MGYGLKYQMKQTTRYLIMAEQVTRKAKSLKSSLLMGTQQLASKMGGRYVHKLLASVYCPRGGVHV